MTLTCSNCGCVHNGVPCSAPTVTLISSGNRRALVDALTALGHKDGLCWSCGRTEMPRLSEYADDQLRAECESRGIDTMTPEMTKAWAGDRAFYLRKAENLERERDEWKRRAEAAEAELCDPKKVIRVETPDAGSLVPLGSVHDCGRLEFLVTRRDDERLSFRDMLHNELGPGIASKPPPCTDGHWVLDEDLLAEDA